VEFVKKIAFTSAWILLIMNAVFLFSWHCNIYFLLQLPPSNWQIPYCAVLCLLLSAFALFSFIVTSNILPKVCGISIFLLGSQRVIELLYSANPKMYSLLNKLHFYPAKSCPMVLAAAIGFMLVGIVFAFLAKKNDSLLRSILFLFISMLVIFLGASELFINLFLIRLGIEWKPLFVHFYTSIGFFLVGVGFIITEFHGNSIKS
jgi:hypothetical protein